MQLALTLEEESPETQIRNLLRASSVCGAIIVALNYRDQFRKIKIELLELCIERKIILILIERNGEKHPIPSIKNLSTKKIEYFLEGCKEFCEKKLENPCAKPLSFVIMSKS